MIKITQIISKDPSQQQAKIMREEALKKIPHHIQQIIDLVHSRTYIVSQILRSKDKYNEVASEMYGFFKQGFEIKELRECNVKFKFNPEAPVIKMQMRHFYTNLCMWFPFIDLGIGSYLDESYLINMKTFTGKARSNYYNEKVIKPFKHVISNREMNLLIHETQKRIARISRDFNDILGNSICAESFMDLYKRSEKYREITNLKLDTSLQPKDAETFLHVKMGELLNLLSTEENCIKPILLSKGGIKDKQLFEFMGNQGYKPDITGATLPIPINTNLLIGGFSNVTTFYLEGNSSRKALLANRFEMGISGYFSSLLTEMCADIHLSKTVKKCNTVNTLAVQLKTNDHLSKYVGRHYYTDSPRHKKVLRGDEKDLIGKYIHVYSPIKCNCRHGELCEYCYGELAETNRELNSVGTYSSVKQSEPIGQGVLSTKHLNTTDSVKVEFDSDLFDKFFILNSNEICINPDLDFDINDWNIIIMPEDLQAINEFDTENEINFYVKKFYMKKKKSKEAIEIREKNDKELFISPELYKTIKKIKPKKNGEIIIPISKVETLTDSESGEQVLRLFIMVIANNELTKPLYDMKNLLNYKNRRTSNDIDEIFQTFIDLIVDANFSNPAIDAEIIMSALLRDANNILEQVDWSVYDPKYQVLTVPIALEKSPSVLVGLSSQALDRQFRSVETYDKVQPSFLDPLFKE